MHTRSSRVQTCLTIAALGVLGLALGCGDSANPARPTTVAPAGAAGLRTTPASLSTLDLTAQSQAEHLNPTELASRGWTCFEPIPNRVVCSHPNQGLPPFADPPPPDRPASFSFLLFDDSGRFVGTEVLLRTELYQGQICESTGRPYDFVEVIGYYECVHAVGH